MSQDGKQTKSFAQTKIGWFYTHEPVRAIILTLIVLSDLVLIWFAFFGGQEGIKWPCSETFEHWKNISAGFSARQWMSLITPAAALTLASIAHVADGWCKKGQGIRNITRRMGGVTYNLETDVIGASMTKQSILAAIASILIVIIQAAPKTTPYLRLVWVLSTCGFVVSIVLLLVSMLCYDYASRFNWNSFYKADLVGKALRFDIWSWYALLTSLVLSIALISTRLSVASGIFAGILMWWYYFFRPEKAGTHLFIRGLSDVTLSVTNLKNAKDFYQDKIGLKVVDEQAEYVSLKVGEWSRIKLIQSSAITAQEVVFTISPNDVDTALKTLFRNNVGYTSTQGPAPSISIPDPDGYTLKICSLNKTQPSS